MHYWSVKFHENPSNGSMQTDKHDEANTVIPRLTSDPANEFFG